ncbi:hypothetical protein THIOM_002391 [Candidatus Thiomargarita nelsonii]|uniref:Uncharacterized protein n=1 Tax=Candidatus Thiomargarita nelsonii TaxID=1003181 RepID=A0A176S1L9_9GAMM|nr:hypothetical protein THIOM_002391 [Candidatus Thiomargarita nelsonii]
MLLLKVNRVGNSTRLSRLCNYWCKCWNLTKGVCLILAVARAACLSNQKSLLKPIRAILMIFPFMDKKAIKPLGDWQK